MARTSWRNWSEDQWQKSYESYLRQYNDRYDKLFGHINPELNRVQYKSAYMLYSQLNKKNVIRTIVYAQDKYKASAKQVKKDREAVAGVLDEIDAKIKVLEKLPSTSATVNQIERLKTQAQSMAHITKWEWKTQTGGAATFWQYLKTNKKAFNVYVDSPQT